eukprot:Tamp_01701.p2 GENE.Tamp_01701~~Tamp_01701.p2  ORF type:complete len:388 (-),score=53.75 Tamp_01701:2603-3766(-)
MLGRRNAQQWSRRDNLDRLAYRLSNVMVSGPWHKFTCIMLANIILIFLGGCLLRLVGGASTWDSALFKSYALLIAAPGADSVNEATWINSTAANLLFLCGIFTFATVLGIITSSIEAHVEWVLEANHRVVEKDHTVILNWSERLLPVLRQLAVARAANGYKALPVVIMADKNVGEMRELVRAGLGSLNLPVTVRQGSGTTVEDLEKVAIGHARNVLILSDDAGKLGDEEYKVQWICPAVMQQRCQPARSHGAGCDDLHTLVVQPETSQLPHHLGFTAVQRMYMAQRVMSAIVFQHGISEIYYDIFTEGAGTQIYIIDTAQHPWLRSIPFGELGQHFADGVCLGWLWSVSPPGVPKTWRVMRPATVPPRLSHSLSRWPAHARMYTHMF